MVMQPKLNDSSEVAYFFGHPCMYNGQVHAGYWLDHYTAEVDCVVYVCNFSYQHLVVI